VPIKSSSHLTNQHHSVAATMSHLEQSPPLFCTDKGSLIYLERRGIDNNIPSTSNKGSKAAYTTIQTRLFGVANVFPTGSTEKKAILGTRQKIRLPPSPRGCGGKSKRISGAMRVAPTPERRSRPLTLNASAVILRALCLVLSFTNHPSESCREEQPN
jgi:hypothetical protein